jgi:prevent-host-death family protein
MIEIGAFEAKNHFSRLLERARNGEEFTITHRGIAVARLGPARDVSDVAKARAVLDRLRSRATRHEGLSVSAADILEWKAFGRR